jgi:hypothetical protein
MRQDNLNAMKFRFEPGSYGAPGGFLPSIACLKAERPDQWQYHFVLVRAERHFTDEDAASTQARQDLTLAFGQGGQPASDHVATALKTLGYKSVDGFRVVDGTSRPSL